MFLVVHASVGAAIGSAVGMPWLAGVLGFFSHFLIDIIPHGDEAIGRIFFKAKRHVWLAALAGIDAIAALCLISWLWLAGYVPNPEAAFVGGVAAMVPDILSGFFILSKGRFLPAFDKLHGKNHELLGFEIRPLFGGVVQLLTLVVVWVLVIS